MGGNGVAGVVSGVSVEGEVGFGIPWRGRSAFPWGVRLRIGRRVLAAWIGLSGGLGPVTAASLSGPSPFTPPAILRPSLSPDGRRVLAATERGDGGLRVWEPAARLGPSRAFPGRIRNFGWAGDAGWVVFETVSAGSVHWKCLPPLGEPQPWVHLSRGAWVRLARGDPGAGPGVLMEATGDGWFGRGTSRRWLDVWRVPVPGPGEPRMLTRNPGDVVEWWADGDGQVRLAIAVRGLMQELRVNKGPSDGPWRTVLTFDLVRDPVRVLALSENGRRAWLAARLGADTRGVFELDLPAARVVRRVGYHPEFDFDGTAVTVGNELRALNWDWEVPQTQGFGDPIEPEVAGRWLPVSFGPDGRQGLFHERSDRGWGSYRWRDFQTGQSVVLNLDGELRSPDTVPAGRPMEPLTWTARDGERLHGYLIHPETRPGTRPPLMVLAHGGPWDRDRWGWHPEAQFLAQRGWAVLMVNYRGSAGYGWRFQQLGAGHWIRAADDLIDGARWVGSQGNVDARRVGVAGASFGGFLAVLALSRPDTPFVAAASVGGAFDLERWLRDTRRRQPAFIADTQRKWLLGFERPDPGSIRIPVQSVRRPVLLLHAEDDETVDIAQSVQLAAALTATGTAVQLDRMKSGGHSMGTADQQEAVWTRVAAFLEAAIPVAH